MMFIPWFEVPHVNGDTTHLAALAVTVINEDVKNRLTEIYSGTDLTVKTRLSVDEVFERMSAAIEGAHNAELEMLMPSSPLDAVSERNTPSPKGSWERPGPVEPLPPWAG